jgi:hypothetical protein
LYPAFEMNASVSGLATGSLRILLGAPDGGRREGWKMIRRYAFVYPIEALVKGVFFILLVFMLASCAKRTAYVPHGWETTPLHPPVADPRQQQKAHEPQAPAAANAPLLKPSPAFRETDISANPEPETPPQIDKSAVQPQYLASMHLVDQANAALSQGRTEAAVSLFEQAIQVDVYNGEAFFGLARAWSKKGSMVKASEFARKAEILYQDKPDKLKQVYLFEADIFKQLGDPAKAEFYRRKASRL